MKIQEDFQKIYKKTGYILSRNISRISFTQDNYLLILGALTGLLGGLGAIVFHESIHLIKSLFFDLPGLFFGTKTLIGQKGYIIYIILVLLPALGGLFVGLLSHFFEKGQKGEGIPNVIDAVSTKGGVIKGSVAVKKIIGSALSIGSGGAGGKEGPIVQIGSAIASAFGQFLHLSPDRLKILVGCGAAAGLSAAFNAPLGGALFAMEIILRTFRAQTFSPIIISSVIATALSRSYLGDQPAFEIPKYELLSNYEFFFYLVFGIIAGLASVYFVKIFYKIDDFWKSVKKLPPYFKPALGGLAVGIIGLFFPGLYGFTYVSIDQTLTGSVSGTYWTVLMLAMMFLLKPVATGFTIGSGGNGGTFAPSLFTGAMIGGLFGQIANIAFPGLAAPPGAYALVGMGAVVAGTTHASLTALIMVFEMTNNYKIILPLMMTIIISMTISKSFLKGSLYSLKFIREGKEIDIYGRKVAILKEIRTSDLIEESYDAVYENTNFSKILEVIKTSKYNSILVLGKSDNLIGQISFQNIREFLFDEDTSQISEFLIAKDIMTRNSFVKDDDNGEFALQIMEADDSEFIPVLDKLSGQLLGIVSKANLLNRYQKEVFISQSTIEMETA